MSSRTQYLKSLERDVHNAMKTINDLTRENYELRQMLKMVATTHKVQDAKPQAQG